MTIAPLVAGAAVIAQDLPVAGSYLVSVQALRGQMQSRTRQYQIDRVADVTPDASLDGRLTGTVFDWREPLPGGAGVLTAAAPTTIVSGEEAAEDYLDPARGVVVVEAAIASGAGKGALGLVADGTVNNGLQVTTASGRLVCTIVVGGVTLATLTRAWTYGTPGRFAVAWSAGRLRFVTTGESVVSATPASLPAFSGLIRYGRNASDGGDAATMTLHARTLLALDDLDGAGLAALVAL